MCPFRMSSLHRQYACGIMVEVKGSNWSVIVVVDALLGVEQVIYF